MYRDISDGSLSVVHITRHSSILTCAIDFPVAKLGLAAL